MTTPGAISSDDHDLNDRLQTAFDFTDEDLDHNRRGDLSPAQVAQFFTVRRTARTALGVIVGVVFALIGAFFAALVLLIMSGTSGMMALLIVLIAALAMGASLTHDISLPTLLRLARLQPGPMAMGASLTRDLSLPALLRLARLQSEPMATVSGPVTVHHGPSATIGGKDFALTDAQRAALVAVKRARVHYVPDAPYIMSVELLND